MGFPGGSDGKESAGNAGDLGSIPGSGRSSGEGNGYPLQYSCLENSMDRGAWQATVHWVAESQTRLSGFHFTLLSWSSAQVVFTTWWWHICLIPFTWSDHLLFFTWSDFVHSLGKNTKVSFKATCSYHRHSSLSSHIFTMCDCAHVPYWTVSFLEVRTVSS